MHLYLQTENLRFATPGRFGRDPCTPAPLPKSKETDPHFPPSKRGVFIVIFSRKLLHRHFEFAMAGSGLIPLSSLEPSARAQGGN